MNPSDIEEYLNLIIKPSLEEYAKEHNISIDELMLNIITLEDTGLFNYKGKQSTIYNRLKDNNIKTLKDLFTADENHTIGYGKNEMPSNHNHYIHNEIEGIISLLKYKYLRIYPENLKELLNYQINFDFNMYISPQSSFGYPGDVTKNKKDPRNKSITKTIDSFYKTLKSCGFDQTATKALIDIAYEEKVNNITLGEFLSNLSLDKLKEKFHKVPAEYQPFINILNIINDFGKKYDIKKSHTK